MSFQDIYRKIDFALLSQAPTIAFRHKRSLSQPQEYSLHLNEFIEIYIFVRGNADYIVQDHCFSLTRGDVLIISPHDVHVPVIHSTCDYERFYLLVPLQSFDGLAFDPLHTFLHNLHSPKVTLCDEEKEQLLTLLYQLSETADRKSNEKVDLYRASLFLSLLSLLSHAPASTDRQSNDMPKLLLQILQYISLHSHEIDSVSEIADHFYITPPYLSSLFHKHVGVTASNYLRIKKIAYAKQLLENGHSVAETCFACGFSDSSHFIKNFKQYVGITPFQYKNTYHESTRD